MSLGSMNEAFAATPVHTNTVYYLLLQIRRTIDCINSTVIVPTLCPSPRAGAVEREGEIRIQTD